MATDAEPEVLQQTNISSPARLNREHLYQHYFVGPFKSIKTLAWFKGMYSDGNITLRRRKNKEHTYPFFWGYYFKSQKTIPFIVGTMNTTNIRYRKNRTERWRNHIYPNLFTNPNLFTKLNVIPTSKWSFDTYSVGDDWTDIGR
jgi:hypothetical protein